jgi:hypothetical protein
VVIDGRANGLPILDSPGLLHVTPKLQLYSHVIHPLRWTPLCCRWCFIGNEGAALPAARERRPAGRPKDSKSPSEQGAWENKNCVTDFNTESTLLSAFPNEISR